MNRRRAHSNRPRISSPLQAPQQPDKWHEAGFKGEGVKVGVIERGFDGIQEQMGTKLPTPKAACCYYQSLSVTQTDNFTNDIEDCENVELGEDSDGGPVLEAIYDLAPDADYYIATISHPTFYHNDLNGIVDWIAVEGVDLILFSHVGGWSGPGDGTSIYATSELTILDRVVDKDITWIGPAGDRAHGTWFGFFKDDDNDGLHEFAPCVECDKVTLEETDHSYTAQIRWNEPWEAVVRDMEAVLVNEDTVDIEATSRKHQFFPNDPNELIDFTTPDTQASYCLRVALKSGSDAQFLFNLQSYHRHPLENATSYGSMTSPGESTNSGMLAVGAAP